MAQEFIRIVIDGFHADDYDFPAALQRKPADEQQEFADFVAALVNAESTPADNRFWSVTVIGHADRYDVSGFTADQRRAVEFEASKKRMESAGTYLFTEFQNGLSAAGLTPPTTVDDPTNVGVAFVRAGAADLVHPAPANETERRENRRVKFLAILFSPQPLALNFGEQTDRNVA